jgi:hypothetical protein
VFVDCASYVVRSILFSAGNISAEVSSKDPLTKVFGFPVSNNGKIAENLNVPLAIRYGEYENSTVNLVRRRGLHV